MKKPVRRSTRTSPVAPAPLAAVIGGGLTAVGNGFVGVTADGSASSNGTDFSADNGAHGPLLTIWP